MLEGGVFEKIPKLNVVVTTLAIGGVLMAGGFGPGMNIRSDAPADKRRHVYIDTMGLHPALVSSVVALLGADHVLMGTDWPIVVEKSFSMRPLASVMTDPPTWMIVSVRFRRTRWHGQAYRCRWCGRTRTATGPRYPSGRQTPT